MSSAETDPERPALRDIVPAATLAAGLAPAPAAAATAEAATAFYRGVNVSGAEFGKPPGRVNHDYVYPNDANIDYYRERGFNLLRIPFLWERVQHDPMGPLDLHGDGSGDMDQLDALVTRITSRRMVCVLDVHNYGYRQVNGVKTRIGSDALPAEAFNDLWVKLADRYKGNALVWFGLMNEPYDFPAAQWAALAQGCTYAIRARGARNLILVPGTKWSGAHSWNSSGNAEAFDGFKDLANNFAFEAHQYLDGDSSGTKGTCTPGAGSTRLLSFTAWLKAKPGRRGFLGEFGVGDPNLLGQEQCAIELPAMLEVISKNKSVWLGWAAWGGGRWWWGGYPLRLEPRDKGGQDTAYMKMLMSAK
ncbi:MAG TPA: glycoside hydrolase family 5 protein [Xanthobacteraceae bacterium]|nr:glycoside hydrolase family 5 protein [Xanthobacteraceae bacterium]